MTEVCKPKLSQNREIAVILVAFVAQRFPVSVYMSFSGWRKCPVWERLSAADHCRSRPYRNDLSLREMSLLVGWGLPGRRRERRRKLQPPLSEGQPPHATLTQSSCERRGQDQGSIFEIVYRRTVPRLGHKQTIGAIAHRQCRLVWLILHQRVRYEERGPAVTKQSKQKRTARMIRQLRSLGYRIEAPNPQPSQVQAR